MTIEYIYENVGAAQQAPPPSTVEYLHENVGIEEAVPIGAVEYLYLDVVVPSAKLKTWDGSNWVPYKSWDGTDWVPMKAWDGSQWL